MALTTPARVYVGGNALPKSPRPDRARVRAQGVRWRPTARCKPDRARVRAQDQPSTQETSMARGDIVIVGAARTAVGSFNGAFANTPAHDLGATVIKSALERAGVEAGEVDEVILGQILTAGQGQNPARQAAMSAGVPQEKTAWGLNQLCGSGL